jgi:hypothetical protein
LLYPLLGRLTMKNRIKLFMELGLSLEDAVDLVNTMMCFSSASRW